MAKKRRRKRRKPNPAIPSSTIKKDMVRKKKQEGCSKCGESREHMLDLHHIDPSTKKFGISRGVRSPVTLRAFKAELKKCLPLCRNHHADFHHLSARTGITIEDYLNDDGTRIAV